MREQNECRLTEYRNADFYQRLNMYLQFPSLRSEFILIDRKDLNPDLSVGFKLCRSSPVSQKNGLLGSVELRAKKLFGNTSA